jgi:hypothetical protein
LACLQGKRGLPRKITLSKLLDEAFPERLEKKPKNSQKAAVRQLGLG